MYTVKLSELQIIENLKLTQTLHKSSFQPPAPPTVLGASKRPRRQCRLHGWAPSADDDVLLARLVEQLACPEADSHAQP